MLRYISVSLIAEIEDHEQSVVDYFIQTLGMPPSKDPRLRLALRNGRLVQRYPAFGPPLEDLHRRTRELKDALADVMHELEAIAMEVGGTEPAE